MQMFGIGYWMKQKTLKHVQRKESNSQRKGIFKEPPVVAGWDLGLLKRKLGELVAFAIDTFRG